ncbi:MAG TPA: aspartate-semialdehyde dehydrogenase [Methylomirabilota bacterium]|jgi:aspartate-semialdehyde dehydrogenase|nr:aspartate-semialdehyde dehydrogenase [Methylomirabilota bacterium]
MTRKRVAVVGATGVAGQQFLVALSDHPWFEPTILAASERSAGKAYRDAITDAGGAVRWYCQEPLDPSFAALTVQDASKLEAAAVDVVFTAVESDAAKELEPLYAKTTPVVSTASAFRYEHDVPILIPGVNLDHDRLISVQKRNRGWNGFVTPVPNCTTTGLAMTLKPLDEAFGIQDVIMTSLQGVSGAGRSPGVVALDIIDNVVPFIPKEEEKVETETRKILGRIAGETVKPAAFRVSATCTRVPVLDAHTEVVSVSLKKAATVDEAKRALREHGKEFLALGLPSSPAVLIDVSEDPFRPQPRLDRDREGGMLTAVGRVRADHVLPNGIKYVLVSHNTKMGAAKGAVLVAEYLLHQGHI